MTEISKDKQIELLSNAIGDIAKMAMIISPYAELTGPQLLLIADTISGYISHIEEQVEKLEKYRGTVEPALGEAALFLDADDPHGAADVLESLISELGDT